MEDIKTIHELDENLNQRIIIIKKEGPLDIITSSNKELSYYHCNYIRKYLENAYLEDPILQEIGPKISVADGIVTANIIYYLIKQYNDIVFVETTEDYGKERIAILYLPDEIKQYQYELMEQELKAYINNFSCILIQGRLTIKKGKTEATYCETIEKDNIDKVWEILKNMTEDENRKKCAKAL